MRYPHPVLVVIGLSLLLAWAAPASGQPPFPSDFYARLRLDVSPPEAMVYVDGFMAGEVDNFDGIFQNLPLVPGHHEIAVYLDGHRPLRQKLYLAPGSRQTIKDTLVRLAPGEAAEPQPVPRALPPMVAPMTGVPLPPPMWAAGERVGTLALRVAPVDAIVFVDGEVPRGSQAADRLIIQLLEGPHRIRVEKQGYQFFAVEIEVRAGETTSLSVSLVR